jgi:hypothetical protein
MARSQEEGEMKFTNVLIVVMFLAVGASLPGCCGGSSKTVVTPQTQTTTLGQELQDLEAAHQKGAISEAEYEKAKKNLLKQRAKEK